jgi:cyclopropane-fatty-acyl-phospholipid synthase
VALNKKALSRVIKRSTDSRSARLRPHFEDVQAHYDSSNDFFELFLDPTRTYSCAFFEREEMTLEEAQIAKIDLALGKLGLSPGMTLLDVGCGRGATMLRAIEKYDVNVIGLTLSRHQRERVQSLFDKSPSSRTKRVLLQGWEQFDGQVVDRIVSIGAFEHFGHERYPDFFKVAYEALPADGVMLLHTITGKDVGKAKELGLPLTFALARFVKLIMTEIFPGGGAGCPRSRWCRRRPPRAVSPWSGSRRCRCTTHAPWTSGRPRSRRTRTRRSRSSPKRSTTAI